MAITKIQSESLNLADDYAFTGTITGAGESNTPSWSAKLSSDYNIYSVHGSGVSFKVPFANEVVDTDSAYDATTNYRFTVPTGGAGKYFINSHLDCYNDNTALQQVRVFIYKNGTTTVISGNTRPTGGANQNILHVCASGIVDLAETDYIEIYANLVYSPGNMYVYSNSMFSGVKLSS